MNDQEILQILEPIKEYTAIVDRVLKLNEMTKDDDEEFTDLESLKGLARFIQLFGPNIGSITLGERFCIGIGERLTEGPLKHPDVSFRISNAENVEYAIFLPSKTSNYFIISSNKTSIVDFVEFLHVLADAYGVACSYPYGAVANGEK